MLPGGKGPGCLSVPSSQWYPDTVHGLPLSLGRGAWGMPPDRWRPVGRANLRVSWYGSGAVRWSMPVRRAGRRAGTTARSVKNRMDLQRSGSAVLPAAGSGQGRWWMKSRARSLPVCWSATAMPPTTTMTAPSDAAGPTCCATSTTGGSATPGTIGWRSELRQCAVSTARPPPAPIRQNNHAAASN